MLGELSWRLDCVWMAALFCMGECVPWLFHVVVVSCVHCYHMLSLTHTLSLKIISLLSLSLLTGDSEE